MIRYLALSLLLHIFVLLPFAVVRLHTPEVTRTKLVVEIFGMIADRQQEERRAAGAPQPKRVALRQVRKQAPKMPEKEKVQEAAAPVERQVQATPGDTAGASALPAVLGEGGRGGNQRATTIGHGDREGNKTMEYLARLSKRLQSCLVYPKEVRKSGIEGVSRIRFVITETGAVKPGSLTVVKSSGYPALDSNALKAALAGSPYEKPPKELLVTIAVAFTMEMATRG